MVIDVDLMKTNRPIVHYHLLPSGSIARRTRCLYVVVVVDALLRGRFIYRAYKVELVFMRELCCVLLFRIYFSRKFILQPETDMFSFLRRSNVFFFL